MRKTLLFLSSLTLIFGFSFFVVPKPAAAGTILDAAGINLGTWMQTATQNMMVGVVCNIADFNVLNADISKIDVTKNPQEQVNGATGMGKGCVVYRPDGKLEKSDRAGTAGALGGLANLIDGLYTPPASGVYYIANGVRNLGIVGPVYAQQGTGFSRITGLLPIWSVFRNIAYIIFVLIFILIGFAIMFRVKLDPRTVISIESAIPKLVITLILITFSYAIAGLIIDLSYVIIGIIVLALQPITGITDIVGEQEKIMRLGFLDMFGLILGGLVQGAANVFGIIGGLVSVAILPIIALLAGGLVSLTIVLVLALILLLITLYVMVKLFIELLKTYVTIVFYVIFAPIMIAAGALPGVPGFGDWLKNLTANIAVFPVVAIYFVLAHVFVSGKISISWTPPGFGFAGSIPALIGFGMILMAPTIPNIVKDAFKIKPFKYGAAIGEAVGFGAKPVTAPTKAAFGGAKKATEAAATGAIVNRVPFLRP